MTRKVWVWTVAVYLVLMAPLAAAIYFLVVGKPNSDGLDALMAAGFVLGLPVAMFGSVLIIWDMAKFFERANARVKSWKAQK